MKKLTKAMGITGWVLVVGELLFFAAALMSPTATLPGPVAILYDGLVALFGGYRAGGALRLWITAVVTGVVLIIGAKIIDQTAKKQ